MVVNIGIFGQPCGCICLCGCHGLFCVQISEWSFPESHNIYRRTIIGAFGSRAKQICLCVEIADKLLLLGVTEQQITLLGEIEDPEEIDRLRRQAVVQPIDNTAFASQLSSLEELTKRVPSLFREGLNRRG